MLVETFHFRRTPHALGDIGVDIDAADESPRRVLGRTRQAAQHAARRDDLLDLELELRLWLIAKLLEALHEPFRILALTRDVPVELDDRFVEVLLGVDLEQLDRTTVEDLDATLPVAEDDRFLHGPHDRGKPVAGDHRQPMLLHLAAVVGSEPLREQPRHVTGEHENDGVEEGCDRTREAFEDGSDAEVPDDRDAGHREPGPDVAQEARSDDRRDEEQLRRRNLSLEKGIAAVRPGGREDQAQPRSSPASSQVIQRKTEVQPAARQQRYD